MLKLDRRRGILGNSEGRVFDPHQRSWNQGSQGAGEPVTSASAVAWLQRESGHPLRAPVAVVGPRKVKQPQYACAEDLGAGLAEMGLMVACGGGTGIMEAVCRGVAANQGIAVGILPGTNPEAANPFVTLSIASGIGEARNALIARAGLCIVAIGNSHGTLSEVALGLQFGKPVFGLQGAADVEGIVHCSDASSALLKVADCVLAMH